MPMGADSSWSCEVGRAKPQAVIDTFHFFRPRMSLSATNRLTGMAKHSVAAEKLRPICHATAGSNIAVISTTDMPSDKFHGSYLGALSGSGRRAVH